MLKTLNFKTMDKPSKIMFLDIETFASWDKPSMDDLQPPANYKDPIVIAKWKEANLDIAWRRQALSITKGQIICIGYSIDENPVQCIFETEESELMRRFAEVVEPNPYIQFCGHNAKRFDLPWLWLRAVKYNLKYLKSIIPHSRNDNAIIDTMEVFSASSFGSDSWLSLDELCKFLGIEGKGDMDGSKVHDAYVNKEYDKISTYCMADVERVRTIYKMTQ
jgi:hypothetical protein